MCTVSFIHLNGSLVITSNRDEEPERNAQRINKIEKSSETVIIYPEEPQAGGSWIAVQSDKRAACLLNGAYEPYSHDLKTTQSRGVMLLESFDFPSSGEFISKWDFNSVAPFTMIMLEDKKLLELIWDGQSLFDNRIDTDHHLWSSVQLYTESTRREKKERFEKWISTQRNQSLSQDDIMHFHQTGHPDFLMANERVKTISVSSIHMSEEEGIVFKHLDLVSAKSELLHLS